MDTFVRPVGLHVPLPNRAPKCVGRDGIEPRVSYFFVTSYAVPLASGAQRRMILSNATDRINV